MTLTFLLRGYYTLIIVISKTSNEMFGCVDVTVNVYIKAVYIIPRKCKYIMLKIVPICMK